MIEICAEAGVNHCGSEQLAHELIDAAKESGADIVKFQTFSVDKLLRTNDPEYSVLSKLALPRKDFITLARYAEAIGIEFMSTPGDVDSLRFLVKEVGVKRIKIGSDDLTYRPLVEAAFATKLPIILSTGMATRHEVTETIYDCGRGNHVTLLHCVSSYPTEPEDANLLAMKYMIEQFDRFKVGYSDHTKGYIACIAAAAMGAVMIEKHIALDDQYCVDESVSLWPDQFEAMVRDIRLVEKMLGHGRKEPCEAEKANIAKFRKGKDGLRGSVG